MILWNRLERTQNTKEFSDAFHLIHSTRCLAQHPQEPGATSHAQRQGHSRAVQQFGQPRGHQVNEDVKVADVCFSIWVFPKMLDFLPNSSILIGFSNYKPSILGYPYFWKHPYVYFSMVLFQRWSHSFDGCHSGIGWQLSTMLHWLFIQGIRIIRRAVRWKHGSCLHNRVKL